MQRTYLKAAVGQFRLLLLFPWFVLSANAAVIWDELTGIQKR